MEPAKDWRASLAEHRSAWIIATACVVLVIVAALRPELFHPSPSTEEQSSVAEQKPQTYAPVAANRSGPNPPADVPASVPDRATDQPAPEASKPAPGQASRPLPRHVEAPARKATPHKSDASPSQPLVSGSYYVQVGAFRDQDHAKRLARRISRQGWHAHVVRKSENLHAVWVGPRASRSLAQTLQESLKQRLNLNGFIVKKAS